MTSIRDIQEALVNKGFNPGPVDGISGRKTIRAIKDFQGKNGLVADGIVGRKTIAILFSDTSDVPDENYDMSIPLEMPWMAEAYNLIGTQEDRGAGSNEAIIGWGKDLDIDYSGDEIPWCGLFVAHCIGSQLLDEALPTSPLGARQWRQFGEKCDIPQLGSIMVFWRGSPDGWKGHVGFYWAEDDDCYQILGGNQSDSVSIVRLKKDRLLEARWPSSALTPDNKIRLAKADGGLISENEA